MNPNKGFNRCDIPQESTDKSIDAQRRQDRIRREKVRTDGQTLPRLWARDKILLAGNFALGNETVITCVWVTNCPRLRILMSHQPARTGSVQDLDFQQLDRTRTD